MKTKIELDVKLWQPPNFVIIKAPDPTGQDLSIPLSLVDAVTLDRLCGEYRAAIFEKAGKSPPPKEAPVCRKCGGSL